jgi:hypothetical protein
MNGSSRSAGAAEHWAASAGAAADGAFAGASAASSKCADTALFDAPEAFNAEPWGVVVRAADDDGAWAATAGAAWAAFAAVAWAVFSAFLRICAELSSLKSIAGAVDS